MNMEELKFKLQRLAEDAVAGRPGAMDNAAAAYEHASDLVKQMIARHDAEQAERAKPIDEEWLRSIGMQNRGQWRGAKVGSFDVIWSIREGVSIWGSFAPEITTRGQLLDLLSALKGGAT